MASDLSTYLGNKIIRWLGGNAMPSAPSTLYVALFNGDPKSGGTEVTLTIDATGRKAVSFTPPASGTTNTMSSTADVDFGLADGSATVTHFAVMDASTSGNVLASDVVTGGPISVATSDPVKFNSGNITFDIGS